MALATAKQILLRHWRESRPRVVMKNTTTTMAPQAAYERVTYSVLKRLDHYTLTWSPFTDWLSAT